MLDCSIIIVAYNPGDLIINCLNSLPDPAQAGVAYEVIVVDNASQDGTVERVKSTFPAVRVIASPDNRGFAAGVNQGLAVATGRYLLLLNPDVILSSHTLSDMIQFLEAHSQVGIIGPRIYDGHGHVAMTAYTDYTPLTVLWQYLGLNRVLPYIVWEHYRRQCEQAAEAFSVKAVQGSCFMLRREVYQQIGGLDESFFLFCEEPDYCERARMKGWVVKYLPTTHVTHFQSSTVSRYTPTRVRAYHICPLAYFRRRNRPGAVLTLKVGFTFELIGKLLVRLVQIGFGKRQFDVHVKTYVSVMKEMWSQ